MAVNNLNLNESSSDFNEELIWTNNNLYYTTGPEFGKTAVFLLQQELMYAANLAGAGNILNPAAILGLVPFSQGLLPTTIDALIGVPLLFGRQKPLYEKTKTLNYGGSFGLQTGGDDGSLDDNTLLKSNGLEAPGDVTSIVAALAKDAVNSMLKNVKLPLPKVKVKPKIFDPRETTTVLSEEKPLAYNKDINFYFESLNYTKYKYIKFEGIIENLSESYNPVWNSTEIFGRIHPLWTYSNVNRTINLDFIIYAHDRTNLKEVYEQANWLAKHTYPIIEDKNGLSIFKSGPLIGMTIGGLFKGTKGFISSLDFDWNYLKRWSDTEGTGHLNSKSKEIWNFNNLEASSVPQGLKVSMRFTVLEDKIISNRQPDIPKMGVMDDKQKESIYTIYNPFS